VAESPYRSGYGVEDRVREPNAEERLLIEKRREEALTIRRKNWLAQPRDLLNMAGVALIVLAFGAILGKMAVVFGAGVVALMCGGFGWMGYRKGLEHLRAHPSRWDAPGDEWRTHETRIRARSVVYAASEDEDYTTWIVFEIPGGEWAAIDDLWLPPERRTEIANGDLVITWLEPVSECLGVETHGGPLPRHGALRLGEAGYDGDDFAKAIEDGFGWGDEDDDDEGAARGDTSPIRRVPEDQLAPWMRDAVRDD
jgi:hypothetical protein